MKKSNFLIRYRQQKSNARYVALQWLLFAFCVIAVSWYISVNLWQLMLIQGSSMEPSYHNLQLVILDKHSHQYETGDVIAFRCNGLHTVLVKRIAAVPGDSIVINEGTLYVNDKVSSVYPDTKRFDHAGILAEEVKLEPEQYIVIGDNITESRDSRYPEVGVIQETDILGKLLE